MALGGVWSQIYPFTKSLEARDVSSNSFFVEALLAYATYATFSITATIFDRHKVTQKLCAMKEEVRVRCPALIPYACAITSISSFCFFVLDSKYCKRFRWFLYGGGKLYPFLFEVFCNFFVCVLIILQKMQGS